MTYVEEDSDSIWGIPTPDLESAQDVGRGYLVRLSSSGRPPEGAVAAKKADTGDSSARSARLE